MKAVALFLLLMSTTTLDAHACKRCGHPSHRTTPTHHTPTKPCPATPPVAAKPEEPSLGQQILNGFELNAGFRWDRFDCHDDLRLTRRVELPPTAHDPFFLGAQVRLPIYEGYGLFVRGERDWTEAPRGNVALGVYFKPFYRD